MEARISQVVQGFLAALLDLLRLAHAHADRVESDTSGREARDVRPLSDTEKRLLEVVGRAERPLKGSAIAARAGLSYGSHVRAALAGLVRAGKLVHAPRGGYWPAGRPVPDAHDD